MWRGDERDESVSEGRQHVLEASLGERGRKQQIEPREAENFT